MLEAGIDHPAHHQNGDSRHCQRNHVFEDAQVHGPVRSPARQIHHQVHGGDHGSRRHRNGQPHKIAALAFLPGSGRHAIKPRQAQRGAQQVQDADAPTHLRRGQLEQDGLGYQQRRGNAEGDNIRQRIEFPPERAVLPAHAGNTAVKQVKQTCRED